MSNSDLWEEEGDWLEVTVTSSVNGHCDSRTIRQPGCDVWNVGFAFARAGTASGMPGTLYLLRAFAAAVTELPVRCVTKEMSDFVRSAAALLEAAKNEGD